MVLLYLSPQAHVSGLLVNSFKYNINDDIFIIIDNISDDHKIGCKCGITKTSELAKKSVQKQIEFFYGENTAIECKYETNDNNFTSYKWDILNKQQTIMLHYE